MSNQVTDHDERQRDWQIIRADLIGSEDDRDKEAEKRLRRLGL